MSPTFKYIQLIVLHIIIGIVIYFNESVSKIYFFGAFSYFLFVIIAASPENKTIEILKACAYFVGAEVFFRTTRGAISYEAGKYMVILFILFGFLFKGISGKGYPYFIYLMMLIPSIFVASTTLSFDANFRTNIAFVLSGPLCLGLASLFCYNKKISFSEMSSVLLYILLPIIAHTAYIYLYTPNLRDILSSTASNRAAAGGFGANQVSAVLGLGMVIACIRLFTKSPTFILKILNASLLSLISFRAVTTLSRGGVLTAIAAIAVFIFFYYLRTSYKKKNQTISMVVFLCFCLAVTWTVSVRSTGGITNLRYTNKDHLGREKSSLTTGRLELFQEELEGFISNPFFGIGSSRAKDQRIEIEGQGVTSHSEFSRTLAEHGIFGVVILLILIFKPLDIRAKNKRNYYFFCLLAIWFLTINHMSMRIAMPAFIYALALLNVTNEKYPVYRKQAKLGEI